MSPLLQPGDRCAGHEIVCHLGTSGPAEIYAARTFAGELRTFKIFGAPEGLASKRQARFAQEGDAISLIVHPNVVRFYDAGVYEGRAWMSLEPFEGVTLAERIRTGGPVPLDHILHWILQACDGIAEAHRMGVVHRDLAPDNILLTPGGGVKIVAFGVAKLDGWGVETTREQQIGAAMYTAPEHFLRAPADPRMDIYTIGLVLYEAIAGVHAIGIEPRNLAGIIRWHCGEEPRPLCQVAPWAPLDLEALVHQAIEKDADRRPATMRSFIARLREVIARLRAPSRRAALNIPLPDREGPLAPTMPMGAVDIPPLSSAPVTMAETPQLPPQPAPPETSARGGTISMEVRDRAAMLPIAVGPTLVSATYPTAASQPAEPRSTDVPVERAARPSSVAPRRARAAAVVMGALAIVAAAGWTILGRGPSPAPATASQPPSLPASVPPPATAPPAPPTATASASLPAKAPRRPPVPRVQPRSPSEPKPAKNRLFGTDG